jgi:hypothetical protein
MTVLFNFQHFIEPSSQKPILYQMNRIHAPSFYIYLIHFNIILLSRPRSGQENRINGRGDPLRWPRGTLYPQKLAVTSPTSGGRSVGIVRLRTKGHGV